MPTPPSSSVVHGADLLSSITRCLESLSVVIPAYNAAGHVVDTLDDVRGWLDAAAVPSEIIVVDDGSLDETPTLVRHGNIAARLLRNDRNRGKGYSVRRGMLAARHDWVLFMDVDNSTRIHHLEQFAPLASDHDVIIASRRLDGARIVRRQPRLRQLLGRTFPYLVRLLAIPDLSDTQCGFKLFRRDAVRAIFPRQRIERFAFDVEVLMLAKKLGLRIAEVPVDWDNPPQSTLRISGDSLKMVLDVLSSVRRIRRGLPEPARFDEDGG